MNGDLEIHDTVRGSMIEYHRCAILHAGSIWKRDIMVAALWSWKFWARQKSIFGECEGGPHADGDF